MGNQTPESYTGPTYRKIGDDTLNKFDDLFAAGVIIGSIGNVFTNLLALILHSFGLKHRFPWNDLAALYFEPPYVQYLSAQLFGVVATFGVTITNAIIIGAILKLTGRNFAYLKSIFICLMSTSFAFMILYPSLGLKTDQYSITTTYTAFFGSVPFAVLSAFLFLKYTDIVVIHPETEGS